MDNSLVLFWGLAVWRATRMIHTEHGPLEAFTRLRAILAAQQKRSGGLFDLVTCFYCLSFWLAIIPSIFIANNIGEFIGYTLAISGIAIIIQTILDKLNKI